MGSKDTKKAASRAVEKAKAKAETPQHTPVSGPVWKILSVGTTIVATKLATDAAQKGWKLATGRNVPVKGDFERERTRDVILFTALSSMAVAAARVAAERGAATYYRRSTGHLPKALEDEKVSPTDKKASRKLAKGKAKAERATQKAIDKATGRR
ncbi:MULTISPECIES: DUF4235 domain-containing protein [Terrabacter]|jgi:hypothetical protein|uniref:DUF4235 domain-containing protein n=1 Tax=Terrabacter tumescens TaxID=60443 RepID=A0ABQ2I7D8_9MICO|nr:DUF4235 domain-containing protein [Terrabacter tumescens]WVM97050.1 DUF4235 domain-containing protein [Terrabacter sp. C0L_2]GGN00804.1 hypothetical protein GCM10009721_29920 [Terrabacter tumescens]